MSIEISFLPKKAFVHFATLVNYKRISSKVKVLRKVVTGKKRNHFIEYIKWSLLVFYKNILKIKVNTNPDTETIVESTV